MSARNGWLATIAVLLVTAAAPTDSTAGDDGAGLALDRLDGVPLVISEEALDGSVGLAAEGTLLAITLDADVLFEFDSADLSARAQDSLDEVRSALDRATGPIEIVGHTDSVGSDRYNDDLSQWRAESVREALSDDQRDADVGVDVDGRGERDPVAPNTMEDGSDNPEGRARNRRVTITIPGAGQDI